tara:strand:+ start:382 stop:756 length:375 start_codon:yes stop_codon:yes gene_type:complete
LKDILLVSFGAILGANARFIIYTKLEKINLSKDFIILLINTFSSFFLGFFLSFLNHLSSLNVSDKLVLFCSIGFLGSLSTFSTFVYDLFYLFTQLNFSRALKLFIISLFSGVIALVFGFLLGNY